VSDAAFLVVGAVVFGLFPALALRRLPDLLAGPAVITIALCLFAWASSRSDGRWPLIVMAAVALTVLCVALRISVAPSQTRVLRAALTDSRWVKSGRLSVQKLLGSLILHVDFPRVGRGRWLFWHSTPMGFRDELDMRLYVSGAGLDGARRARLHVCDRWGSPAWLAGACKVTPKGSRRDWLCWPPGVRRVRRLIEDERLRSAIEGLPDVSLWSKRGRLIIKMKMHAPIDADLAAAGWPDRTLDLVETIVTRWAELTRAPQ
jgi:hypothetical protein